MKSHAISNIHRIDQVGKAIARQFNDHAIDLPHDISERLRVARIQAVSMRKPEPVRILAPQLVPAIGTSIGNLDEGLSLWSRLASALPLVALLFGLATLHIFQNEFRANEIAQVDAELLTDDLPPSAYTDPGFLIFLKSTPAESKGSD